MKKKRARQDFKAEVQESNTEIIKSENQTEDKENDFSVEEKAELLHPRFEKEKQVETFVSYFFTILIFVLIFASAFFLLKKWQLLRYFDGFFSMVIGGVSLMVASLILASIPLRIVQSKFMTKINREQLSKDEFAACNNKSDYANPWTLDKNGQYNWKEDTLYGIKILVILVLLTLGCVYLDI